MEFAGLLRGEFVAQARRRMPFGDDQLHDQHAVEVTVGLGHANARIGQPVQRIDSAFFQATSAPRPSYVFLPMARASRLPRTLRPS